MSEVNFEEEEMFSKYKNRDHSTRVAANRKVIKNIRTDLVHSLLDYGNAVLQSASQPTCTWCVDCSRCSMRRQRGTTHLPPATIRPHHRCVGDTTLAARPRTRAVQDRIANVQSSARQRATISGNGTFCRRR